MPLNEDALSRAPAWLRWIVRRKRAHWEKSVYLLTGIEPGGGADGSDALVGVNITRLHVEEEEEGENAEAASKPPEADGLTTPADAFCECDGRSGGGRWGGRSVWAAGGGCADA